MLAPEEIFQVTSHSRFFGELGRSSEIKKNGGRDRDHWPDCHSNLFAGLESKAARTSDRMGAYPTHDTVGSEDVAAVDRMGFKGGLLDPCAMDGGPGTLTDNGLHTGNPLYQISLGIAGQVNLVVVPERSAIWMLLGGLFFLRRAVSRRRKTEQ